MNEDKRVLQAVSKALEEPQARRRAVLVELLGDDARSVQRAVKLLESSELADSFLSTPASLGDGLFGLSVGELVPGSEVGAFRVVRRIASGGMGDVYLAEQAAPRRHVALKLMRAGLFGEQAIRRFQFEVDVLSRLQHPAIARIYDAGVHVHGGLPIPFFALEFVEDAKPLCVYAEDEQLTTDERLGLFLEACGGVEYGHRRGVVHRDLKPANLLVDRDRGVKVIDYGIARPLGEEGVSERTRDATLLGTLGYMSPEQLDAPADVDTRADVYSLGAVLHELLAGRPPFDLAGKSFSEAVRIVTSDAVEPLVRIVPDVPRELGWIVERALRKEREQRYPSVSDLADDVRRYLDGLPLVAGPDAWSYRLGKFLARHRLACSLAAAVLLSVLLGLVGTGFGLVESKRQASAASLAAAEALRSEANARASLAAAKASEARALQEAARREVVLRTFFETIGAGHPEVGGRQVPLVEALRQVDERAAVRLAEEPLLLAEVDLQLGMVLLAYYELDEAERLLRVGLALADGFEDELGDEVFAARLGLAEIDMRRGRLDDALKGLKILLDREGATPARRARVDAQLSQLALLGGRPADALGIAEHVLEQPVLDPTLRGDVLDVAAQCQRDLGRFDAAYEYAERATVQLAEHVGVRHPKYLRSLFLRSDLEFRLRRNSEAALAGMLEALEAHEAAYGIGHPTTIQIHRRLGPAYAWVGQPAKGEEHVREAVRIVRQELAGDPQLLLVALNDLAVHLGATGKPADSVPILEEVLELKRAGHGWESMDTVAAIENLARTFLRLGEPERALALIPDGVEVARRVGRGTLLPPGRLLVTMGRAYDELGRDSEAIETYRQALEELEARQDLVAVRYRQYACDGLAVCLGRLGRNEEAAEHREELRRLTELRAQLEARPGSK